VVSNKKIFKISNRFEPNLAEMFIGWSYKIFVFGADRKSNMAARAHNIFKISTNQNTLSALAAMLDFRSAPKTKILYMTIQ
jgi:hypothetical protein